MYSGMSYDNLKTVLKKFYGVTSTELDRGVGIPFSVYCIKSFFRFDQKWVPADFCKIGKSFSVANRARIYSQSGTDVKTLWAIELAYPGLAPEIENLVHNFGVKYHAGTDSPHCTEVFDLNVTQAFTFLDNFMQAHDILNDNRITKIHMFDTNKMHTFKSNVEPLKLFNFDNHYNNLFQEVYNV